MANRNDDLWPHDIAKLDGDRTTFNWKIVTVDGANDGQYGYGLRFVEDTSNSWWNCKGEWNDQAHRFDDYAGEKYQSGDVVEVQMVHRTYTRRDGSDGEGRDINKIRRASGNAQPSPVQAAPQQAQAVPDAEPRLTTDQKIARAQALNIIKDLLIAGIVEPTLNITEAVASQIVRDETLRLALGKHVSLDYLSPMVQVGIELDGTVTEIKNKPGEDEAGDTVETLDWNTGESTTTV